MSEQYITDTAPRPLDTVLHIVERYAPPWLAAIVAALGTLVAQVAVFINAFPATIDTAEAAERMLGSGSLAAWLPAPLAALIAYLVRRARPDEPAQRVRMSEQETSLKSQARPQRLLTDISMAQGRRSTDAVRQPISVEQVVESEGTLDDPVDWDVGQGNASLDALQLSARVDALEAGVDNRALQPLVERLHRRVEALSVEVSRLRRGELTQDVSAVALMGIQIKQLFEADAALWKRLDALHSPEPPVAEPSTPLSIRHNNPLNIEATREGRKRWRGEADSDNRYARFSDEVYGLRAAMYLLVRVYYLRYSLVSVRQIVERWSPLGDNTEAQVKGYAERVADALDISEDEPLTIVTDRDQLFALVRAMAEVEAGHPLPSPPYTVELFHDAWTMLPE